MVGAGISGVAAARELRDAGLPVVVLDRGRRIGGRMASRTIDGRPVDIGASYFTVSDPAFETVVADWQQRGLAHPWTDTFQMRDGNETSSKSGPMRWGTPHGLRSLVEDLAAGLDVRSQTVAQIGPGPSVDGQPASAVLLAMPDPQARRLLGPAHQTEADQLTAAYEPVLALTQNGSVPEGDSVWLVARKLDAALTGRRIAGGLPGRRGTPGPDRAGERHPRQASADPLR